MVLADNIPMYIKFVERKFLDASSIDMGIIELRLTVVKWKDKLDCNVYVDASAIQRANMIYLYSSWILSMINDIHKLPISCKSTQQVLRLIKLKNKVNLTEWDIK